MSEQNASCHARPGEAYREHTPATPHIVDRRTVDHIAVIAHEYGNHGIPAVIELQVGKGIAILDGGQQDALIAAIKRVRWGHRA